MLTTNDLDQTKAKLGQIRCSSWLDPSSLLACWGDVAVLVFALLPVSSVTPAECCPLRVPNKDLLN